MKLDFVEKIGSFGTIITAAACPVCWPLFIPIGSALGLGILQPYEGFMMNIIFPIFVMITFIGSFLSYRIHKSLYPLIITNLSVIFILFGFYIDWNRMLMYIGIIGVIMGSIAGIMAKRNVKKSPVKI